MSLEIRKIYEWPISLNYCPPPFLYPILWISPRISVPEHTSGNVLLVWYSLYSFKSYLPQEIALLLIQKPLCVIYISFDKILTPYKNSYTRWMKLSGVFYPCWQGLKHSQINQPINQNSSHTEHQMLIMLVVKYRESCLIRPQSEHVS